MQFVLAFPGRGTTRPRRTGDGKIRAPIGARFSSTSSAPRGSVDGSPKLQAAVDMDTSLARKGRFIYERMGCPKPEPHRQ
eukprot:4347459-Pyramimonas_sp.AAC.1